MPLYRSLLAVALGLVAGITLTFLGEWLIEVIAPESLIQPELEDSGPISTTWMLAVSLLWGLTNLIAGYVTATIVEDAEVEHGLILAALLAGFWLLLVILEHRAGGLDDPLWYRLVQMALPLPFVTLGAYLRALFNDPLSAGSM